MAADRDGEVPAEEPREMHKERNEIMDWICPDCGLANFNEDEYAEEVACEICGHVFKVYWVVPVAKVETKEAAK